MNILFNFNCLEKCLDVELTWVIELRHICDKIEMCKADTLGRSSCAGRIWQGGNVVVNVDWFVLEDKIVKTIVFVR